MQKVRRKSRTFGVHYIDLRPGLGYNYNMEGGYAFTNRYKKGWNSKPVFLMKNVKHVYAAEGSTIMLKKNNSLCLYWCEGE